MEVFVQEEDRALCIRKSVYEERYSCSEHRDIVSLVATVLFQRRKNRDGTYDLVAILDEDSSGNPLGWVIGEEITRNEWPTYREWIRNFSMQEYREIV